METPQVSPCPPQGVPEAVTPKGRMERLTLLMSTISPRVEAVTPKGVWKHLLRAPRLEAILASQKRSRRRAYGNSDWPWSTGVGARPVQAEVTPKGIWKLGEQLLSAVPRGEAVAPKGVWKPRLARIRGTLVHVPEAVTPKGVWKLSLAAEDPHLVVVPEAVTPKGVWKRCRATVHSPAGVPEAVTPKGVWKRQHCGPGGGGERVPEAVTPKGVWKRAGT